jgi:hypothetical protein
MLHRQQPDVGGHHHAQVQANHVTGDQVHHVDAAGDPTADHHRLVPDGVVQRRPGPLGAVLVGEPQSHADREDDRDDNGIGALAHDVGHDRRGGEQPQQGRTELPYEHRHRRHPVGAHRVRPHTDPATGRLSVVGQSGHGAVQVAENFRSRPGRSVSHANDGQRRHMIHRRLHWNP